MNTVQTSYTMTSALVRPEVDVGVGRNHHPSIHSADEATEAAAGSIANANRMEWKRREKEEE